MNLSRHLGWLAAPAAMLALSSAPASAQNLASDVRCFVASNLFANLAKDAKAKQAGSESRFFYLGRLNGPPAQIEAAMIAQSKTITKQNAGTVMQACARAVVQKANEIQALAKKQSGKNELPPGR